MYFRIGLGRLGSGDDARVVSNRMVGRIGSGAPTSGTVWKRCDIERLQIDARRPGHHDEPDCDRCIACTAFAVILIRMETIFQSICPASAGENFIQSETMKKSMEYRLEGGTPNIL